MEKTKKIDDMYMNIAETISLQSHSKRKQVGAIIVKNSNIISYGWNGTPHGFDNACEINDKTKSEVIHAEANAITKVAKSTNSSENSVLYVTMSPCIECAKLIIQSGISEVIYLEEYRDTNGIELLNKANIKVIQYKSKN